MPIEIAMPSLSANMEVGTVARWLMREGDTVSRGDVIAEIETDKAVMEMEAKHDGVLAKILVPEGAHAVKVGETIALLSVDGTAPVAATDHLATQPVEPKSSVQHVFASTAERPSARGAQESPSAPRRSTLRIKASPLARRLARQHKVDLSLLIGSGPGARIIRRDVEQARSVAMASAATVASSFRQTPEAPHEVIKLSGMRKAIARRLSHAKNTIPHFYLTVDIRVDALLRLRAELNDVLDVKISLNDMLIRALALALGRVPDANVQYAETELYRFKRADVSVAVAVPGGLVTPVVRDCSTKPVSAIASEMKELVERARSGKLLPHEYEGGTASLSNLGMYGVKQFEAIINPPQALIVAVGAGERRAIVVGRSELQAATIMSATGSFDHRAIDGAVGAQFMTAFKDVLERPHSLLL